MCLLLCTWTGISVFAGNYTLSLICSDYELTPNELLEVTISARQCFNSADITVTYDRSYLTFDKTNTNLRDVALVQESVPGTIRLIDFGEERTGFTLAFQANTSIAEACQTIISVDAASFGNADSAATADVSAVLETEHVEITVKPTQYQVTFENIEGFTGSFPADALLTGKEDYTFTVPSIANYTVIPKVRINGGTEKTPDVENNQVTIPQTAITGNIKVRFVLTKKNACAGTADNGYKTAHQFVAEPVYTWNGFASCSAVRTCDCSGSVKRGYAEATAELIENGQRRQYTAVFQEPFTTQYKYGNPITVTFRLIGDYLHSHETAETAEMLHTEYVTWIPTTEHQIYEGMTVNDVFEQALESAEMESAGKNGADWTETGYVAGIRAPEVLGGYWLREKDNGAYSGWLYSVNGVCPSVSLTECELKEGDSIVWFYADNYEREDKGETWLMAKDCAPETYLWESCSIAQKSEGSYLLDMAAAPQNVQIYVAVYNTKGQMTGIRLIPAQEMTKNAAGRVQADLGAVEGQVKVFFTDKTTTVPTRDCLAPGSNQ